MLQKNQVVFFGILLAGTMTMINEENLLLITADMKSEKICL